jgi:hypothetical protein
MIPVYSWRDYPLHEFDRGPDLSLLSQDFRAEIDENERAIIVANAEWMQPRYALLRL